MFYLLEISLSGPCAAMAVHLSTLALTLTVSKSLNDENVSIDEIQHTTLDLLLSSNQLRQATLIPVTTAGCGYRSPQKRARCAHWTGFEGACSLVLSVATDRKYKKNRRKFRQKAIYPKRRNKEGPEGMGQSPITAQRGRLSLLWVYFSKIIKKLL